MLLAPSLVFLALFTYLPIARVAIESLYDTPLGTGARTTFVGLGNFAKVLADPAFRQAAANNLVYALGTLIPSLVLALAMVVVTLRGGFWVSASTAPGLYVFAGAVLLLQCLLAFGNTRAAKHIYSHSIVAGGLLLTS